MKRNRASHVGLGAASLIMILLVLSLALMGVLSLISARADLGMGKRYAELAGGYATASAEAQCTLAKLDALLAEAQWNAQDERQYAEACMKTTQAGECGVDWNHDREAVMRFDAGSKRVLEVVIERTVWNEAMDSRYRVVSYRLLDTKEWKRTEGLILMDM